MKKISIFLLLIVFCEISNSEEKIRLTTGEWPPFISGSLKNFGVISHVVADSFENEGIQVEYGFFPWKRSLETARMGTWDGSTLWVKTPDREKDFYLSKEPVYKGKYVFFHLKDSGFTWDNIEGLKKYKLGTAIGYSYGADFDNYVKTGKIETESVPDDIQNIRKLLAKRIDAVAIDENVGLWLIKNNLNSEERDRIVFDENPLIEVDMYILLSKKIEKNFDMIEKFDRGFKKLKDSKKYEQYFMNSKNGMYE